MREERKAEIVEQYIRKSNVSEAEYGELELQELVFLIHTAKGFGGLEEKIQTCLAIVHEKIRTADALYLAFDKVTNYPYVDPEDRVWMFSKEEYARLAEDYFLQQLIQLEMRQIGREQNMAAFAEMHRLGLKKVLLDNGQFHMDVERDAILPPMDWKGTPEINIPVTNPELQHAMIRFFQTMASRSQYESKQQHLYHLEGKMIGEVLNGKYLVPMKLQEEGAPSEPDADGMRTLQQGATLQFACLEGQNETTWLPAFTDWIEFEKAYDKTEWNGNVATYDDLAALSERMDGLVINPRGIAFSINANSKQRIEEFRAQQAVPRQAPIAEQKVEAGTKILLGEPKESPAQLIQAVAEHMKQQKRIKKAYLLQMNKHGENSYLIVVEAEGNPEDLFRGIADAASPHLQGMPLDLTVVTDWVMETLKEKQPFYRKKRFGLF